MRSDNNGVGLSLLANYGRSAPPAVRWACLAAWAAAEDAEDAAMTAESVANVKDLVAHCDLLREVVGNPFRPASLGPAERRGAIEKIAQASYDDLDFSRLPVLADALEEAGCADEAVLAHLRGPGPHARGCWALDLVDIPWRQSNSRVISVSQRAAVARLDELIGLKS